MATQYVVTTTAPANNSSRVIVHTEIATLVALAGSADNAASTPWQTAAQQRLVPTGTFQSAVPTAIMPSGRQAELDAADRIEWELDVEYDANGTNGEKQTSVETAIAAQEQTMLEKLINELRFWGFNNTIGS